MWTNHNSAVVALLLNRGADATLGDNENRLPFALANKSPALKDTDVYWRLNDARF